ncbi:hypothetical protein FQN53_008224 [Emmonsiellopsis sp. PD_33]|nr:hypothetical protein FQN53_008224 [Emmonsiellopsis sp. PD_33]
MSNDPDLDYQPLIESFELYHIYHAPSNDAEPPHEDWKTASLKGPALPALGQAVSGAAGAAVSTIATYPLSLIVTRLQLQRQLRRQKERQKKEKGGDDEEREEEDKDEGEYKSILDAAVKIYKSEGGLSGLYTGVAQATGKAVTDSFIFFLTYSFLRQRRLRSRGLKVHALLPVLDELAVGYLSESFTKLLTTPISTVLTRKQVEGLTPNKPISSTGAILRRIVSEKGIRGLWSGYSASLFLSLNPSITFFLAEMFKYVLLPRNKRKNPPAAAIFLFAAVSKAIAASVTYPFSMAKTRAQATSASTEARQPPTVLHAIYGIARTEGPAALYAGLDGDVLRGFFSHGITMLVKNFVHALVVRGYYLLLMMLRRYPSSEELLAAAKERADGLADSAVGKAGSARVVVVDRVGAVREAVTEKGREVAGKVGEGAKVAKDAVEAKKNVVVEAYVNEKGNETAEMVGEYVEDEAEEWRSLYHWFWGKGK